MMWKFKTITTKTYLRGNSKTHNKRSKRAKNLGIKSKENSISTFGKG
jgi:hypothetical protein